MVSEHFRQADLTLAEDSPSQCLVTKGAVSQGELQQGQSRVGRSRDDPGEGAVGRGGITSSGLGCQVVPGPGDAHPGGVQGSPLPPSQPPARQLAGN